MNNVACNHTFVMSLFLLISLMVFFDIFITPALPLPPISAALRPNQSMVWMDSHVVSAQSNHPTTTANADTLQVMLTLTHSL